MKQTIYTIVKNERIAEGIYRMVFAGDASAITRPGQLINIKLDALYLRRPFSVCDWQRDEAGDRITIIYKTVGVGTDYMATLKPGVELDVLTGLGNGFDTTKSGEAPLVVGGGVGTPPLYALCKQLVKEQKKPSVVLGFNTKNDVFYEEEFAALGIPVTIVTMDGSHGCKGLVTDACRADDNSYLFACGPLKMLEALCCKLPLQGQISLEERMGCGFGACMGCTINTKEGARRVCKDGPVFEREVLLW